MKKFFSFFLASSLIISTFLVFTSCNKKENKLEFENNPELAINEQVYLKTNSDNATFMVKEGANLVALEGDKLTAMASGKVVISAQKDKMEKEMTFNITPSKKICGFSEEKYQRMAVWVDINTKTNTIVDVLVATLNADYLTSGIVGDKNYGEIFCKAEESLKPKFIGQNIDNIKNVNVDISSGATLSTNQYKNAILSAIDNYKMSKNLTIRNYQTAMTGRYLANNPFVADLKENIVVETKILAYPTDCAEIVETDVKTTTGEIKWAKGENVAKFGEHTITSKVVKANKKGLVVIEYSYKGQKLYDAVEIFDNFTTGLEINKPYGKVLDKNIVGDIASYTVIGDKAMNEPGGTVGGTVLKVDINNKTNTIDKVKLIKLSDSTYLEHSYEYGGNFTETAKKLYDINLYLNKFKGLSSKKEILTYSVGGEIVSGGVDYIVTGATKTADAIIKAVNSAIILGLEK